MIEKMLALKEKLTPDEGFNLVAVDDFEQLGEDLFLVDHFDSLEAAEAAQAERRAENPDEKTFVYGSKGEPPPLAKWADEKAP
jgi:hypothetical protein